jgi:hypothetical protein
LQQLWEYNTIHDDEVEKMMIMKTNQDSFLIPLETCIDTLPQVTAQV